MSLFIIEILLASIVKEGYFNSFYFWLDLVASLSLIFDITWFWDAILGTGGSNAGGGQSAAKVAKAGRGARVGTKASRVARIVRLIRLIRIVKLYKSASVALKKEAEGADEN